MTSFWILAALFIILCRSSAGKHRWDSCFCCSALFIIYLIWKNSLQDYCTAVIIQRSSDTNYSWYLERKEARVGERKRVMWLAGMRLWEWLSALDNMHEVISIVWNIWSARVYTGLCKGLAGPFFFFKIQRLP